MICPLCSLPLQLKQINLTEAVYLCPKITCSYPVNNKCYIVKRKLDDFRKTSKNSNMPTSDFKPPQDGNKSGVKEQDMENIDIDELVSNALMHLNYSSNESKNYGEGLDLEEIFNELS